MYENIGLKDQIMRNYLLIALDSFYIFNTYFKSFDKTNILLLQKVLKGKATHYTISLFKRKITSSH